MNKLFKVGAISLLFFVAFGLVFFTPEIVAKTKYETRAIDKKLEKMEDFNEGQFKGTKLKLKNGKPEIGVEDESAGEYLSPVIENTIEAKHLGVHWEESKRDNNPLLVYVRSGNSRNNLGKWKEVHVDILEGKDNEKEKERFGSLVDISEDPFVQAKVFFEGENINKGLKNFTFTLINPYSNPQVKGKEIVLAKSSIAESLGFLKTSTHGNSVSVISREDWGADESLRENSSGEEDWPRSYHGTRKIVVHHTAVEGSNGIADLEENMATMRSMYQYHAASRGWGDIGYNAVVDGAGNVYEGRYGTPGERFQRLNPTSQDIMNLNVEAAHAASYNGGTFGVSLMGDFTSFEVPTAQREGLKNVLAFVADSRGIDLNSSSDFLRYDGNWHYGLSNIFTHRDVIATACPGDKLYSQFPSIIDEVQNLFVIPESISGFSAIVSGSSISGSTISQGLINFNWNDFTGASSYEYAFEKVFGTIYDPQPWETSWINDTNSTKTLQSNIDIEISSLDSFSQYVFYVRALDSNGIPTSNVSHVNFSTGDISVPEPVDTISPDVWVVSPIDGYEADKNEKINISVGAFDNVSVSKIEIYFDNNLKASCENRVSCESVVQLRKESFGTHVIDAKAFDNSGNSSSTSVSISKVDTATEDPTDPTDPTEPTDPTDGSSKPEKCSPWPECKK